MYRELTQNIQIDAEPVYVPEKSSPRDRFYFYAYKIKITNLGNVPTQLLSRHWIITDGHGTVKHVTGPGVVGEQPRLSSGETFEYTSFCPLETPTGNMRGTYQMVNDNGDRFDVRIPLFFLRDVGSLH
jgi:ApaG protein